MEIYVGMIGSFREGKGGNYVVLDHISIRLKVGIVFRSLEFLHFFANSG